MCFGGGGSSNPPRQPESDPVRQAPAGDSLRRSTPPKQTPKGGATQITGGGE